MTTGGAIFYSPATSSHTTSPAATPGSPTQSAAPRTGMPLRSFTGPTEAVQQKLSAVADKLMPQLAQAVAVLQTTNKAQVQACLLPWHLPPACN